MTDIRQMKQQSQSFGESFVRSYYKRFDESGNKETRILSLADFYQPDSAIVWNGLPFQGLTQFKGLLDQLPSTKHLTLAIDCQPMPVYGSVGDHYPILASIYGFVSISSPDPEVSDSRPFSHTFLLWPDSLTSGTFRIQHERYRLL